ncbi:MAG: iron-siderophore ABC transporter substrate-binding protein [Actinomycetota bacterium]
MRSPVRALVALLALFALVASACGGSDDEGASSSASPSASSSSASASASAPADDEPEEAISSGASDNAPEAPEEAEVEVGAFPRTITDALGEVEVTQAPTRVVVLDLSTLDSALALGLEVIGHTTFMDPNGPIPDLYGDAATEFGANSVWVGDTLEPNLELIAAQQPDMIITSAVRHENIAAELSQIATTVMTSSAGSGWKDGLRLVAEATGRESVGEQALADYEARAAAIGAEINAVHGDPTLSVLRFVNVIRVYQPLSFSGVVLSDAGIARPDSQQSTEDFPFTQVSEEELPSADGDWLVYAVFPNEDVEAAVAARQDSPLWTQMSSVADGQAFPVDDDRWMSGVGLFGAQSILDDLETIFGVSVG